MTTASVRYPELDACRGFAIVMMVGFHVFVDLKFLGIPGPDPFIGSLRLFGLTTAVLFVFIAGISAHIKAERTPGFTNRVRKFFERGVQLILIGCGITLVTWWFLHGEGYVLFGILHLIGTCLLIAPVFHRFGYVNLLLAGIIGAFFVLGEIPSGPLWLVWSGIHPEQFVSVDYTPLIPWLSAFLCGMAAGKFLYPHGMSRIFIGEKITGLLSPLVYAGRHSLALYLIHQPVLIVIFSLLSGRTLF